jgi:hypothetical protein
MSISPPVLLGSGAAATGNTVNLTTNQTVPPGALIGVMVSARVTTGVLTGVSDGANGYTIADTNSTSPMVSVAFSPAIGTQLNAGSTITCTVSGTNPNLHSGAFYIVGLGATGVLDLATDIEGSAATGTDTIVGNQLASLSEIVCVFLGVNGANLTGAVVSGNLPYVRGVQLDSAVPNMELWYSIISTPSSAPPPAPQASAAWTSPSAAWGLTMVSFIAPTVAQTFANTPCGISGG